MKEFKGTPGPWVTVQEYADDLTVVDADGFEVVTAERTAILHGWENKGFGHWADEGGSKDLSEQEQFANANLIAAAPELLSALQKIVESGHILPHLKIESQWAIAKALGESK